MVAQKEEEEVENHENQKTQANRRAMRGIKHPGAGGWEKKRIDGPGKKGGKKKKNGKRETEVERGPQKKDRRAPSRRGRTPTLTRASQEREDDTTKGGEGGTSIRRSSNSEIGVVSKGEAKGRTLLLR